MKKLLNRITYLASSPISIENLIRFSGKNTILPFYHTVSDAPLQHLKYLYPVINKRTFEKDIDFFLKHYKPIGAEDIFNFSNNNFQSQKSFFLSFDDGLRGFYENAAPILIRKGVSATCFLNTNFIDNKDIFFRLKASLIIDKLTTTSISANIDLELKRLFSSIHLSYNHPYDILKIDWLRKSVLDKIALLLNLDFEEFLKKEQPYLNTEQIINLKKQGFTFGAHSKSHADYQKIDLNNQISETIDSLQIIETQFNQKFRLFSFPFTDYNVKKEFFDAIKEYADITFGTANLKSDEIENNLQRIPMELKDRKNAEEILKTQYMLYLIKTIFGKHIIKRL